MGQYDKDLKLEEILKKVLKANDLKSELEKYNNYVSDLSEGNESKYYLSYFMILLANCLIITACFNVLDFFGLYMLFNLITFGVFVKNISLVIDAIKYNKYKTSKISLVAPKIEELEAKLNLLEKEIKIMRNEYSNTISNINFIEPTVLKNDFYCNKTKKNIKKRILKKDE